ncbi:MAG: hypothetical protein P8N19_04925, partial [Flavobacteriales bacterium]|nr:hypothetical protein [Flavobacteriales bacterium]
MSERGKEIFQQNFTINSFLVGVFAFVQISINAQCASGNCENGFGIFAKFNGDKFLGKWTLGQLDDHGVILFHDGKTYVGQFVNGMVSGQGVMTYTDGTIYVGEWKDG